MKRASLTATIAFSFVGALSVSCSTADTITPGTGGDTGSGGSATTAGSAGSPTGVMAGSPSTGGSGNSSGSAGTPSTGGMSGGAATGGTGGTGTGGVAGGSGGSGGTAGAAPGGDCSGDCTAVVGKLDGWANLDPPAQTQPPDGIQGAGAKDNVATAVCAVSETRPDHGLLLKEAHWQLKGPGIVKGTNYAVELRIVGVVECKEYEALAKCPRAANAGRDAKYDLWCPGATDPPLTSQPNHYNTDMISVTPDSSATTPNLGAQNLGPLPAADNWWMFNECPQGYTQSHKTWQIDLTKTITVPGESWINYVEFDTNCREILNCGTSDDAAGVCTSHYSLLPDGAVPAPPASITAQPAAPGGGGFGQWVYFDVKSVKKM